MDLEMAAKMLETIQGQLEALIKSEILPGGSDGANRRAEQAALYAGLAARDVRDHQRHLDSLKRQP